MNNTRKNTWFEILRTVIAVLIALGIALIIILCVSKEPLKALNSFIVGPLDSLRHIGNVIEMSIPMIFTGLALTMIFQTNQFNLASEGAFFIGAIGASAIAIKFNLPPVLHPIAAILVGGLCGGLICLIPAVLKHKWKSNELVSSLLINYICFFLGIYIINNFLKDPKAGSLVSYKFQNNAGLARLIPGTRIHVGIIICIALVIICYYYLYRTKWGYELRVTGQNDKFANYSGIKTLKIFLYSQIIAGVISGMGGATELLGIYKRFQWQQLPGYGWDGVIVATIARNNPALVPVAAFFLAYIRVGADLMARMTDVQSEIVAIIQGIMIMLITAESFLAHYKHKMVYKSSKENMERVKVNEGSH